MPQRFLRFETQFDRFLSWRKWWKVSLDNSFTFLTCHESLVGVNLRGANLYCADLVGADLRGADLKGQHLVGADLRGANLVGVNLYCANLYCANLVGVNLYCANLYCADLVGANFVGAKIRGANLENTKLVVAKYLTSYQLKSACFWDKAIYQGKWDNKKGIVVIEPDNTKFIQDLKKDYSSNPEERVDCSRWSR